MTGFGSPWHLARRFFVALSARPPDADEDEWARGWLGPGERELWARMSASDRRHAIGVARTVIAHIGEEATHPIVAAALLHDVGKVVSRFGTFARVGATLVAVGAGRSRVARWAGGCSMRGRLGDYVCHDRIGAELLGAAGADPLTVAWTGEHHLPPARWSVPAPIARVLHAADND